MPHYMLIKYLESIDNPDPDLPLELADSVQNVVITNVVGKRRRIGVYRFEEERLK